MYFTQPLTGTDALRQEAIRFQDQGYYTDAPPNTKPWLDYWREQKRRCLEGYEANGIAITGFHYFYLNFTQIQAITEAEGKSAVKDETFPDFWDGDYNYFWALEIARNGISEERLEDLNLAFTPSDIEGGHHMVVLKARGKGYSYKAGAMLARNWCLKQNSRNYAMAYEKEYLTKDGLLSKAWNAIDFIDEHTAWQQPKLTDRSMHKKAGYKQKVRGMEVEKGRKNEIIGVTLKDNPDKARGKRGDLIFFEEAGKFPGLKKAWEICRPSVEQGKYTVGTMIAYGTGGTEQGDYEALESLFYNPGVHNVFPVQNIWDEGAEDTSCGFFVPAYVNWQGFIDQDGNSLVEGAKQDLKDERQKKKESDDADDEEQFTSENPFTPQEATLRISTNIFPSMDLKRQLTSVQAEKRFSGVYTCGHLVRVDGGGVEFQMDPNAHALTRFPTPKGIDRSGCVAIKESPYRDAAGRVPEGMYIICHDPYAHDGSPEGSSLGAAYVIKQTNRYSHTYHQCIVASYVGRPATTDEYNRNLFMLADYYNCKIGFENDRGDVVSYAKRYNRLDLLERQFEVLNNKRRNNRTSRQYGIRMNKSRKEHGEQYIREWLLTPVSRYHNMDTGQEEDKLVLNTIVDPALLQELIKYDPSKNFDRISALIVGMYYLREEERRGKRRRSGIEKYEDFFRRKHFA